MWRAVEVAALRRNKELEAMGEPVPRYDGRYKGRGYHSTCSGDKILIRAGWDEIPLLTQWSGRVFKEYERIRYAERIVYPALDRPLTRMERALVPLLYLEM